MTFLSLDIEKSFLTTQKSQLEFEEMMLMNQIDNITEEMSGYLSEDEDHSADDKTYIVLQNEQEYYDRRKDNIESRLKVMNERVTYLDKAVGENIKKGCSLSFQG